MDSFLFFPPSLSSRFTVRCSSLGVGPLQTFPLTKCSPSTFVPLGHALSPSPAFEEAALPSPPRDTRQVGTPFVYPTLPYETPSRGFPRACRGRPSSGRKNGGRVRASSGGMGTWRDSGFIRRKMKIEVESCARASSSPPPPWTSAELRIIRTSGGSTNARLIATM